MAGSAFAGTIVVGANNGGNCDPFSCPGLGGGIETEYQQVYASSQFPGTFVIDSIDFFQAMAGASDAATYQISFSITGQAVGGLSTTLSNNIGVNSQVFGTFTISSSPASLLTFTGTPYTYDPSEGNLLMDVVITGESGPGTASWDEREADSSGAVTSRAYSGTFSEADTEGLVTQFDGSSVPEPSSFQFVTLVMIGLAVAAGKSVLRGTCYPKCISPVWINTLESRFCQSGLSQESRR
jgi:hypothetical protein